MYFRKRRRRYYKPKVSKSETAFLDLLEKEFNVKIDRQFKIWGRSYDGKYKNVLLELDGAYWHSSIKQKKKDLKKTLSAMKNGYQLIRLELNDKKEIYKVLEENYSQLESIFINK